MNIRYYKSCHVHVHVHVYSPRMTMYAMCYNETIIGKTSQAKSSYSRLENEQITHKSQRPSKKLGKINTITTVFKSVNY